MPIYTYEIPLSASGASSTAIGPDGLGAFTGQGTTDQGLSGVNPFLMAPDNTEFDNRGTIMFATPAAAVANEATNTVVRVVSGLGISSDISLSATVVAELTGTEVGIKDDNGVYYTATLLDGTQDWGVVAAGASRITDATQARKGPHDRRQRHLGHNA